MRQMNITYNSPRDNVVPRPSLGSRWFSPLQPGSVRSCTVALAATSLGSGALALPYAFSLTGLGLGLCTLALTMVVSSLSLQILMVGARYTNSASYSSMLSMIAKSTILPFTLDLFIVLNGVGSITCTFIFEGDFIPSLFSSPPWGGDGVDIDRRIAVLAVAAAVYPLTFPSDISALRYTSVMVPVVLIITIAIVWVEVPEHLSKLQASGETFQWWDFDLKRFLQATSIMVNAFTNQQNAVPSGNRLDQPSVARIVKATFNANFLVFLLLASMGIGGYLSWGSQTQGDFIKSYAAINSGIWVCRLMLAVTQYFVIPVALLPASKSLAQLVLSIGSASGQERQISRSLHILSATACMVLCAATATATDDVGLVISILGGVFATSVMFWFPALIYWIGLWPTQPPFCRYLVLGSMVCFGMCGFISASMTILAAVQTNVDIA
eukprot:TRINITY_DN47425_c0_g1_i1.p1 TRINITY_DN47425_c0_g1~~TRINITY_DN47425_c0_g1_i1.p1  ORF type:complete len:516 (-),score=60.88 TRINITY_DN47425_c0_g1_i1:22-1338(-)